MEKEPASMSKPNVYELPLASKGRKIIIGSTRVLKVNPIVC